MKEKETERMPEEEKQEVNEEMQEEGAPAEEEAPENGEAAVEQIESLRTSLARLQADFANFKNRTERERKDLLKLSNEGLILKLLPVIDNFERAFADQDIEDPGCAGFYMIYNELMGILQKEGVQPLESDGELFDPNLHHALFIEESTEIEEDHVIETFQKGYTMGEKLIRPAMVKVSKHK